MSGIEELKGRTITQIDGLKPGAEEVRFKTSDGKTWIMKHEQDCCESVSLEEVVGDVADIIGSPLLLAEEVCSSEPNEEVIAKRRAEYEENWKGSYYTTFEQWHVSHHESETWTFYKLSTIKGSVTIRWYGHSNGYYSERVDFYDEEKGRW